MYDKHGFHLKSKDLSEILYIVTFDFDMSAGMSVDNFFWLFH